MAVPEKRAVRESRKARLSLKGNEANPKFPKDAQWSETRGQDPGQLDMLKKAQEFFQTCDTEGKGFITKKDMQRLHNELPLSLEDLEDVFDTLDADGNGFLTPEEFNNGFSHFFFSQNNYKSDEQGAQPQEEKIYQSRCEEVIDNRNEHEEDQFHILMDKLGAQKILEDESDVKQLWEQLKKHEPHLLSNFEEFLSRIFCQLQEAHKEKDELECALKKKIATYDEEVQHLYEEMEQQIKNEKEQFLLKDVKRFQCQSQELEQKLVSKEQELEQLVQKQKRLEGQFMALNNDKHETKAENTKLKLTNQELAEELERTSSELQYAQLQLESLQKESCKLQEEKEMEVYRVTENLQREKTGLLKQLDFLREKNKHLRDERDMCLQKDEAASTSKASWKQRSGSVIGKYVDGKGIPRCYSIEEEDVFSIPRRRSSVSLNGITDGDPGASGPGLRALRRIISIEEDPLPQLLDRQSEGQLSRCLEEEESAGRHKEENQQTPPLEPISPRGQPVGKETGILEKSSSNSPDRLFKIVFVGNSSVGKTSFLKRFCDDRFSPGTAATVGLDYQVKTLKVDKSQVALQLWDTAGQERYRCITQQFFRKADGVIVMYDITAKQTFMSIRQWLTSVEEAAGENIPILLLGNKVDNEKEREVPQGHGERLAKENDLIFYECSAYSDYNVKESMLRFARILKEQEDTVRENIIQVHHQPKKSCCGQQ
ncbi:EF-hand calcium-binding domain-containing protein 4B isoform X2 [Phascolarctos cinereus]|uniref:EF-hand calcium-binding domain-containing protein 4B isoform X2 n=1 Tax=Phascolarctos cinereus TaxID=38626 RepID=A0A6P5LFX9_PHACI|nr:EF-hand calcium-binding domain-containing protein 4B isoform X2 [Phascolarctos cinereus]